MNVPTGHGSDWAGITSGKILSAKRVTQSGRGGSSRVVWDRVEAAAASHPANRPAHTPAVGVNGRFVPGANAAASSTSFPSLGAQAGAPSRGPAMHSTAWSSGGAGSTSKSPTVLTGPVIRSVNYPVPQTTKAKAPSQAAFPSLPAANGRMTASERQALFAKPNPRDESIRRITGQSAAPALPGNGWGTVPNDMERLNVGDDESADERPIGGKKKGKGKQLLFTVSARPG